MDSESISARARQFQRHETKYEVRIEPHVDHADQFRVSYPGALGGLAVLDVGKGGLGFVTGIFIPKNLRLVLHVSGVADGLDCHARDLVVQGVVRRCVMSDHKPTYKIGVQFTNPGGHDEQKLIQSVAGQYEADKQPVAIGGAGVAGNV
ncbi:MAG: PilZ domain-containing protein [Planctomycetota bacterium]